jgi:hypothetical protein
VSMPVGIHKPMLAAVSAAVLIADHINRDAQLGGDELGTGGSSAWVAASDRLQSCPRRIKPTYRPCPVASPAVPAASAGGPVMACSLPRTAIARSTTPPPASVNR